MSRGGSRSPRVKQAAPLTVSQRLDRYRKQRPTGTDLTSAQRRRMLKKARRVEA